MGEKEGRKERKKEKEDVLAVIRLFWARFALTRRKFAMGEVTIVGM